MHKEYEMKGVPVEVFSRVVGYYRPVSQWNRGKKEEFDQRKEVCLERTAVEKA